MTDIQRVNTTSPPREAAGTATPRRAVATFFADHLATALREVADEPEAPAPTAPAPEAPAPAGLPPLLSLVPAGTDPRPVVPGAVDGLDPTTTNARPDGTVVAPPLPRSSEELPIGVKSRYVFPAEVARAMLQDAGIFVGEISLDPASPNYTFGRLLEEHADPDKRRAIEAAAATAARLDGYWLTGR